jgi:ribosome-associated protein
MISKPSKSARKREYLALQALGEQLIGLTAEQLHSIGLPESLLDAVVAAQSISAHGALRRQKQLIGKIMRNADPEPIRAALESFGSSDRISKQIFRDAETWRERIVAGDPDALNAFFEFVGWRNETLVNDVNSWFAASDDKSKRILRRRIFREIHDDLSSKMQSTTSSI